MNLGLPRHEMSAARRAAEESFAARLQASGKPRGVFAAKKGDTEGELLIYEVIGEDFWTGKGVTAPDIAEKLDALKGVSRLHVYINSPGGDLFTGKTVYNELKRFPAAEKIVHVDGIAASAASLIAMAGTKIITESGGTWLVHRVMSGGYGNEDVHRKVADELHAETMAILGIYEERTKRPAESLHALMCEDRIISGAEAKAFGLTDEISEVEQKRMDEAEAKRERAAAAQRPLTTDEVLAAAMADWDHLRNTYGGASPSARPGEPGKSNSQKPDPRQKVK